MKEVTIFTIPDRYFDVLVCNVLHVCYSCNINTCKIKRYKGGNWKLFWIFSYWLLGCIQINIKIKHKYNPI